jgi:hypothetical protein
MAARTFEDLIAWQKAYRSVLGLYRLTNGFPGFFLLPLGRCTISATPDR